MQCNEDGGMVQLVIGLGIFLMAHAVPTLPGVRRGLVGRLGEGGYKAAFSIVSIVGLALIVVGYGRMQGAEAQNPEIWTPPVWTRHLAFILMLPAMILLVATYVPSRVRSAIGHPMLTAIKLWAASHLLANGDLASILLFGSFLAFAGYDRISVERRGALGPLGSRSGALLNDVIVVIAGVALYTFMLLVGHARLIGVALVPGWT
jgi:uncharacterized membrane protein